MTPPSPQMWAASLLVVGVPTAAVTALVLYIVPDPTGHLWNMFLAGSATAAAAMGFFVAQLYFPAIPRKEEE